MSLGGHTTRSRFRLSLTSLTNEHGPEHDDLLMGCTRSRGRNRLLAHREGSINTLDKCSESCRSLLRSFCRLLGYPSDYVGVLESKKKKSEATDGNKGVSKGKKKQIEKRQMRIMNAVIPTHRDQSGPIAACG